MKQRRVALGLSQSQLSRLAQVSRYRINSAELGSTELTIEEQERIREALQAEAARLHEVVLAAMA